MPRYATVVLDTGLDREFDYRIPPSMEHEVKPGMRVYVPFRAGRALAYVTEVKDSTVQLAAKDIIKLKDTRPLLPENLLKLARWISEYYFCSIPRVIGCMIPSSVRRGHAARLTLFVRLNTGSLPDESEFKKLARRAPKQAEIIDILKGSKDGLSQRELLRKAGGTRSSVDSLVRKGIVSLDRKRVFRDPWAEEVILPTNHLPPTEEQSAALGYIRSAMGKNELSVVLLHGVTGSGKTEVYLQAMDEVLKCGRGAIVLVPEISLTPQTIERFKSRFSEGVAVLHSRLSFGERLDEWERLRDGKARVVVGARSAIFAPIPDLGLIVVDEEHERTYKQEVAPRYHARDVAVMRGKIENATVILGSATPSIESYRNARTGKYALFNLPRRIEDRSLPEVKIVDMREEIRRAGRMTFFSRRLITAMEERLERGEQVILFLNRRGFSSFVICRNCGYVEKCPNCSISLTMHGQGERLLCHICGFQKASPEKCHGCGKKGIRFLGLGTQKLEMMVSRLFPRYKAGRMDTDSMTARSAHAKTLNAFKTGKIRILLGTQMIAKGLHFPNVTLVGVILADTALHLPDFRSSEYTFQLLTQVAGRAGRGTVPGEVIIQTFAPRHPAILAAGRQDYEHFFNQEFPFRQDLGYPPVKKIILVTVKGRNSYAVEWIARQLKRRIDEQPDSTFDVLGPAPSPISRAKGHYRWQLILKGSSILQMGAILRSVTGDLNLGKKVQILMDADPISML